MVRHGMHFSWMHAMHISVGLHMRRLRGSQISMLGLLMSPQIHLPLKGPSTQFTSKWLEPSVLARVGNQVRALTEGLAANLAFVGFLTSMYVGMLLHIRFLVETLSAVLTRVGSGVRVDQKMGRQRA